MEIDTKLLHKQICMLCHFTDQDSTELLYGLEKEELKNSKQMELPLENMS